MSRRGGYLSSGRRAGELPPPDLPSVKSPPPAPTPRSENPVVLAHELDQVWEMLRLEREKVAALEAHIDLIRRLREADGPAVRAMYMIVLLLSRMQGGSEAELAECVDRIRDITARYEKERAELRQRI